MKTIKIYQIDMEKDTNGLMFRKWDYAKIMFDFSIYEKKWEGKIKKEYNLEDVFEMFNLNRPQDFRGHSLSVSDIVYMDGKYFYCDSFGWQCIG